MSTLPTSKRTQTASGGRFERNNAAPCCRNELDLWHEIPNTTMLLSHLLPCWFHKKEEGISK